jgi:hypothetical protein
MLSSGMWQRVDLVRTTVNNNSNIIIIIIIIIINILVYSPTLWSSGQSS